MSDTPRKSRRPVSQKQNSRRKSHKKYNRRILSLLRRLLLITVVAVLIFSVCSWKIQTDRGNLLPMPLGFGVSVVLSGSMEPTLFVDDVVVIGKTDDFQIGDVLIYQSGDMLVIHRLIAVEEDRFLLRGDANNTPDAPVAAEDIRGKLLFTIPGGGAVLRFLRQPVVILALFAAVFLLTELSYRRDTAGKKPDKSRSGKLPSQPDDPRKQK